MSKKKRSHSSQRWVRRQQTDYYVQEAQKRGLRSRAGIKLEELQQKDKIFKQGMTVVDLGAAPGGWSQMIRPWLGSGGRLIALDILPMEPLAYVEFIEGDFTQDVVLNQLVDVVGETPVDIVASDIAPNFTGIRGVDQARCMMLVELALDFALNHLKLGGCFLVKCFQGEGYDAFIKALRVNFEKVVCRKPQASRSESREVYVVAQGRRKAIDYLNLLGG